MDIALATVALISLLAVDSTKAARTDGANPSLHAAVATRQSYLNGAPLFLPSLMRYAHRENLTTVRADYLWRAQQRQVEPSEGLAEQDVALRATSFMRLSKRITTYGYAAYCHERTRGVAFLNSSDFHITFPYTSATEAGGTDRKSSYSFSGGCDIAIPLGTLGLEVQYRAMQMHRTIDPRPLNVISDFHGRAGYSLPVSQRYLLAGVLRADVYKQSSDVSIYNPQAEPLYLLMNGLGNSFFRHNISDSPILYRMRGFGGALALRPKERTGVWGSVGFMWKKLTRYAVEANVAPINRYTEPSWQAYLGYIGTVGTWTLGGGLTYAHALRYGRDYILGSSDIREYKLLGTVPNYAHERIEGKLELAAVAAQRYGVRYALQGVHCRQLQNAPQLALTRTSLINTLSGYATLPMGRQWLRLSALVQCLTPMHNWSSQMLPASYTAAPLERYTLLYAAMHTSLELDGSLAAAVMLTLSPRFLLEVGARASVAQYGSNNLRYAAIGELALHFQ